MNVKDTFRISDAWIYVAFWKNQSNHDYVDAIHKR